jgi:hypothetical protein
MRTARLLIGAGLLLASCGEGKKGGGAPDGLSSRPLKPEHRELVRRLAEAVVRKDYRGAYETMSEGYRRDIGWTAFEESIRRYREAATNPPRYEIRATEDDPKKIDKEGVVELFVPAALRGRIVEEAAIHFSVRESDGEEGFWALVCWIIEEDGAPRILNYYQDD